MYTVSALQKVLEKTPASSSPSFTTASSPTNDKVRIRGSGNSPPSPQVKTVYADYSVSTYCLWHADELLRSHLVGGLFENCFTLAIAVPFATQFPM
jgi:hypothetical protein